MKRSDRARYSKSAGIGSVLGLAAGWRIHTLGTSQEVAGWIENNFQTGISAAKAVGEAFGIGNWVAALLTFARGPALPITVGLVIAGLTAFALLKKIFDHAVIDRLWPSYPDLLDPRLERENIARYRPLAAGTPFLERDEELEKLVSFADNSAGRNVGFLFLTGREGIGKTRLAIEWLKKMKARGWDAGILDQKVEISEIRSALLRNKTAILIDEPGRIENFWFILDALLQKQKRVRIVLANQIALRRPNSLDDDTRARIEKGQDMTLRLHGMTDDALRKLAPEISDEKREDAQGCPLMVLIKPNDFAEIERRVALREEAADAKNIGRVLALAALAGPVARTEIDRALGVSVATSSLEPLFEDIDRATLDAVLPAVAPEIFADEIVLRYAEDHPGDIRMFFERAVELNAAAVAHRAATLWRRGRPDGHREKIIAKLIEVLDEFAPEQRDAARARVADVLSKIAREMPESETDDFDLASLTAAFNELADLAESRPFDSDIRLEEAEGAFNAITAYGIAGQFAELERWGTRLIALCEIPVFRNDRDIRLCEAKAAFNAITAYGAAGQFAELERWGARLIALCEMPAFRDDRDIRLEEARGVVNTVGVYGEARQFAELERWEARLIALCEMPAFRDDRDIRLEEAKSVFNAATLYGTAGQFAELERWGAQLIALCEMPAFRDDGDFRLREADCVFNAMTVYGDAGQFVEMERWGARLIALCEIPAFHDDRDIRLCEAKGAYNTMKAYGTAGQFAELERWGARLMTLCEIPAFRGDRAIWFEAVKGVFNTMSGYGIVGQFAELERWGTRLIALCETPAFRHDRDIRLEEAKSAYNAMSDYGTAGQFAQLERWGTRLIALCEMPAFRDDPDIRLREARGAVNAMTAYGSAGQFAELERWGARLIALCEMPAFCDNGDFRLREASCMFNAMTDYGVAGQFAELERWGARLIALCEMPPFRNDPAIRLFEIKGAANAILYYSKSLPDRGAARSRWFARVACAARDLPGDPNIQQIAQNLSVTYVQQQAKGWPYGPPRTLAASRK